MLRPSTWRPHRSEGDRAVLNSVRARGNRLFEGRRLVCGMVGSFLEEAVGWAPDTGPTALHDVGVDHGGRHVLVSEQFLDRPDVGAVLQAVGRE